MGSTSLKSRIGKSRSGCGTTERPRRFLRRPRTLYGLRELRRSMIGWSMPSSVIDVRTAEELGLEKLPLYSVCPTCQGTGRAERSEWKDPIVQSRDINAEK